jgi:rRNA maturation endonuclease Nob1
VASNNHINVGQGNGRHPTPPRCIGCHRRIVYGDRCPDCAHLVRVKAAKRRRKR